MATADDVVKRAGFTNLKAAWFLLDRVYKKSTTCIYVQGGTNMTGTNCDLFYTNSPGHIWTTLYTTGVKLSNTFVF
jgi:hypothetical protein